MLGISRVRKMELHWDGVGNIPARVVKSNLDHLGSWYRLPMYVFKIIVAPPKKDNGKK